MIGGCAIPLLLLCELIALVVRLFSVNCVFSYGSIIFVCLLDSVSVSFLFLESLQGQMLVVFWAESHSYLC